MNEAMVKKCSVAECGRTSKSLGWCPMHYGRWKRNGDPLLLTRRAACPSGLSLEETFRWHMPGEPPDLECWHWSGPGIPYGKLIFNGEVVGAHVASYMIFRGEIPEGFQVRHLVCDNPPCVHPMHLAVGTALDNAIDRARAGRQACGEAQGLAKLTEEDVKRIRLRYAAGGVSYRELGIEFGVTGENIFAVVKYKTWGHVSMVEAS